MPLIVISGYPCSGKTFRARQLIEYLQSKISSSDQHDIRRLKIVTVNDLDLGLTHEAYREAKLEKIARATEYSAIKRNLNRDTFVIADGLNYIKGYRYQLYCDAKAVRTPSCVIHIGTPIDRCKSINNDRLAKQECQDSREQAYSEDIFDNLIFRFEEPNGMNRWDNPLFTLPWDDATPPCDAIWSALVIGTEGKMKTAQPNLATITPSMVNGDFLYQMDQVTQQIVNEIIASQQENGQGAGAGADGSFKTTYGSIDFNGQDVNTARLHRCRRQFISQNRQQHGSVQHDSIGPAFLHYIDTNLNGPG